MPKAVASSLPSLSALRTPEAKLLPCPLPPRPSSGRSRSHRCRSRHAWQCRRWNIASGLIAAVNAGYEGPRHNASKPPVRAVIPTTAAQLRTQAWAWRCAGAYVTARREETPSGAPAVARLLRRELPSYNATIATHAQVEFLADAIDEPEDDRVVPMLEALDPENASFYDSEKNVLASGTSPLLRQELEDQYAFLGGSHQQWVKYLNRKNMPTTMWSFSPPEDVKALCGVSAVAKKKEGHLRKLLMCCPANYLWSSVRARASHGMAAGGALSALRMHTSDLAAAAMDESNAFTSVLTPTWWWAYMACPAVTAFEIWPLLTAQQRARGLHQVWHPCYCRLPMGSTHSVHILMSINFRSLVNSFHAARRLWTPVTVKSLAGESPSKPFLKNLDAARWSNRRDRASRWQMASRNELLSWEKRLRVAHHGLSRVINVLCLCTPLHEALMEMATEKKSLMSVKLLDWRREPYPDLSDAVNFEILLRLVTSGAIDVLVACPPSAATLRSTKKEAECPAARLEVETTVVLNSMALTEAVAARGGVVLWAHPCPSPHSTTLWTEPILQDWLSRTELPLTTAAWPTSLSGRSGRMQLAFSPRLRLEQLPPPPTPCPTAGLSGGAAWERAMSLWRVSSASRILRSTDQMVSEGSGPGGWCRSTAVLRRPLGATLSDSSGAPSIHVLNEAAEDNERVLLKKGDVAVYLHVDDGLYFSDCFFDPPRCDELMERCAEDLEKVGFVVPDRGHSEKTEKTLVGYVLDDRDAAFRLPPTKAHLLRESLQWLLLQTEVDVPVVHSLLGIWLWGALLRRPLLSIPESIFSFILKNEGRRLPLWPSVRRELQQMLRVVPAMYAKLNRPACPLLFATDAEGANDTDCGGWGMTVAWAGKDLVESCIRQGLRPARTICRLDGTTTQLLNQNKELKARYGASHIPMEADELAWREIARGRWKWDDHITLGEGRATLRLLELTASCETLHGTLLASLLDNEPWGAATAKGRSPARPLNVLLRRRCSLLLASDMENPLPWINTRRQPADTASRLRA